jgi:hypothetical protein
MFLSTLTGAYGKDRLANSRLLPDALSVPFGGRNTLGQL